MPMTPQDYMSLALRLAAQGRNTVAPNPMVGCVIVQDKQIVGEGWHQRAGEPHAEVLALRAAGEHAQGATAYVTLEPCNHYGRTPPCVEALLQAGIKELYVACLDPNPLMAGKSIAALRAAGIKVTVGICEAEAKQLNEIFFHYIIHKQPFVIAKWAMSLDGKTVTHAQDSRQISGAVSQQHTQQLRQQCSAILVGANTILRDNPRLTARDATGAEANIRQPLRVILVSQTLLPLDAQVFDTALPGTTLVATTDAIDTTWRNALTAKNIEVIVLPKTPAGQVHLPSLLTELGRREIISVLVEGGMQVHQSFFAEKLVNKMAMYLAPVFIGNTEKKQILNNLQMEALGTDFYFSANCQETTHV